MNTSKNRLLSIILISLLTFISSCGLHPLRISKSFENHEKIDSGETEVNRRFKYITLFNHGFISTKGILTRTKMIDSSGHVIMKKVDKDSYPGMRDGNRRNESKTITWDSLGNKCIYHVKHKNHGIGGSRKIIKDNCNKE